MDLIRPFISQAALVAGRRPIFIKTGLQCTFLCMTNQTALGFLSIMKFKQMYDIADDPFLSGSNSKYIKNVPTGYSPIGTFY
jgi:hypothetical protein